MKLDCQYATEMIAHRGLSGLELENTIPAFRLAAKHSYFGIECDVHRTDDGIYVISHDEDLRRVFNCDLCIKEHSYEELRVASLKMDGIHYLPTLQDYLDICATSHKTAVIELKTIFTETEIQEILSICRLYPVNVIFISFIYEDLELVRKSGFQGPLQVLYFKEITPEFIASVKAIQADVDIHHALATKKTIRLLHDHFIGVNVWTVDDEEVALRLMADGVDYITTDILE